MNSINISIQEKEIAYTTETISKIKISDGTIELKNSVTFIVLLMNSNSDILKREKVKIEGEEYTNWGNNDQYILNLILSKLGLTQIS
jgi:hypothetical protein